MMRKMDGTEKLQAIRRGSPTRKALRIILISVAAVSLAIGFASFRYSPGYVVILDPTQPGHGVRPLLFSLRNGAFDFGTWEYSGIGYVPDPGLSPSFDVCDWFDFGWDSDRFASLLPRLHYDPVMFMGMGPELMIRFPLWIPMALVLLIFGITKAVNRARVRRRCHSYGQSSGATRTNGDLDGSGAMDLSDLGLLLSGYGKTCWQ